MSEKKAIQAPVHFGDIKVAPITILERSQSRSQVEHRVTYINNLSRAVTVGLRSGVKFTVLPESSMLNNTFIIRVEHIFRKHTEDELRKQLALITGDDSAELRVIKESFLASSTEGKIYREAILIIDYPVKVDDLFNYGNSAYHHQLDIVLSLMSIDNMPSHPHSPKGIEEKLLESTNLLGDRLGFIYSVEIVDNLGTQGPKYFNLGGNVFKVTPRMDSAHENGIYVTTNEPAASVHHQPEVKVSHYSFDEAKEKANIFDTHEEARTLGDQASVQKAHVLNLEKTLSEEKLKGQIDINNLKHAQQLEIFDREKLMYAKEQELLLLKHEHDIIKQKLDLQDREDKRYYDHRSYERKDTSEMLKFIPMLIVTIGTIFIAIHGKKSS